MLNFRSLTEAYDWLNSHINHERRLGAATYEIDFRLEPFRGLMAALGDPQRSARTIHIAGSAGKGSTALLIEALLRARGLRVATYTSPHFREYRERIRIDGETIGAGAFARALARAGSARVKSGAPDEAFKTVFELLTATFFVAAAEAGVEWMVIETGLGGRLDATNIIDPGPVVLTRVGIEHAHLLGDTIAKIAREKAAILKPGGWAVAARQSEDGEALAIFHERGREVAAPVIHAPDALPVLDARFHPGGMDVRFGTQDEPLEICAALYGPFLVDNLQGALTAIARLEDEAAIPTLTPAQTACAIAGAELTGRMTLIGWDPEIYVDGGHCPAAAAAVAETMRAHFGDEPALAVVGMVADKDHEAFFRGLAGWAGWRAVFCYTLDSSRAEPGVELARRAEGVLNGVAAFADFQSALNSAVASAEKIHRIVVTGSTYAVAGAMDGGRASLWPARQTTPRPGAS